MNPEPVFLGMCRMADVGDFYGCYLFFKTKQKHFLGILDKIFLL